MAGSVAVALALFSVGWNATALTWDPLTAVPFVQAKIEGYGDGNVVSEEITSSFADVASPPGSPNGTASAVVDAAAGTMSVHTIACCDWRFLGSRTVVDYDYFTVTGITGQVALTVHFDVDGALFAADKTKRAAIAIGLRHDSDYGVDDDRSQPIVGDFGTIESGWLTVDQRFTQTIVVSDAHPHFRMGYWLVAGVAHAGSSADVAGRISFDLPAGARLSSRAGWASPIPEPQTAMLVLAGLASMQRARRPRGSRRSRRAAA